MRNSVREDYVIFFLLMAHCGSCPVIPVAGHLLDDIALPRSYPLVSASALCDV